MKKILSLFIVGLCMLLFPTIQADAHTNGHTRQEAVNWVCARGNEAWCKDVDGVYGCQCVDLILAYYEYLYGARSTGNAIDYTWNTLPSGWTRVYSNPQPGDVIVWKKGSAMWWDQYGVHEYAHSTFGHIGIIIRNNSDGTITAVETNASQGSHAAYYQRYATNAACFIRPNFVPDNLTTYAGNHISFDANGGSLAASYRTTASVTGYDMPRGADTLVVYTKAGKTVPTNEWGAEVAIDKNGKVTQIRPYLSKTQLTVPTGGMILSGHGSRAAVVENLKVGNYVYCDYPNKKIYIYDSQETYLTKGKYVASGTQYGTLPTPTRSGYSFKGWYSNTSGGSKITANSVYSVNKLYAQWEELNKKSAQTISAGNFTKTIGNSSFYIKAKLTKGNGKLSYKSSNTSVATVSGSGKVTVKGVGKAAITITAAETSKYLKTTKKITVTVNPKKTSLSSVASSSAETMTVKWKKGSSISGYQIQYSQKSDFSSAKKVKVSKSSTSKKITDLTGGKKYYVRIRTYKTVSGSDYYSAWSSKKSVTVKKSTTKKGSITLSAGSAGSTTCILKAKTYPSDAKVTWSSSDKSVATVNSSGKVTAKGSGTATITAKITYKNKTYKATKKVTVTASKKYGTWSGWSLTAVSANASREVRTTPMYRYYCFYCPVCGGREPFSGNSDCYQYTLTGGDWREIWSTIPYSQANGTKWPAGQSKMYTYSLGDGLLWNFGTANLYDTAIGTKDGGSGAVVIMQGYSSRTVSNVYTIGAVK